MRFAEIDLVRYGPHEARRIVFGPACLDMHLVVGPNAAGKSTMLQAFGDLLFGIGGQTAQAWRFGYDQMLIRAVIEYNGGQLEVTRRKGNKNTLLRPDGSAFESDPLAPLLGGVERALFERMFGLDHAKLRRGGEAILEGKDDVARIVLEAGAGLPRLGAVLTALEGEAAELFKPGGSKPQVNALMRLRKDTLDLVRKAELTDGAWSEVKAARASAERTESALREEGRKLSARRERISRINSARLPLARLDTAEHALAALAAVPRLPSNASEQMQSALAKREAATTAKAKAETRLQAISGEAAKTVVSELVLAAAPRIRGLAERRPVIVEADKDLPRRTAELAEVVRRLDAAKTGAKLPLTVPLPPLGWRKRARIHLNALENHAQDLARSAGEERAIAAADVRLRDDRAGLVAVAEDAALRGAVALWPAGWEEQLNTAVDAAEAADEALAAELAAIAPWRGDLPALRAVEAPWPAQVAELGATIRSEENALADARAAAVRARNAVRAATSALERLAQAGAVPTTEAVLASRQARDAHLRDVLARLAGQRQLDDADAGSGLEIAVADADTLADRREAEAARVAEHAQSTRALAEAERQAEADDVKAAAAETALRTAQVSWTSQSSAMGFKQAILPADFETWRAARQRALGGAERAVIAARGRDNLLARINVASAATLAALGGGEPTKHDAIYREAERQIKAIDAGAKARAMLEERADQLETRREAAGSERERLTAANSSLDAVTSALLSEVGVQDTFGDAGLVDALEAADTAASDEAKQPGLERQVRTMTDNADTFARDARALATELGLDADEAAPALALRLLEVLDGAVEARNTAAALAIERSERQADLDDAQADYNAGAEVIAGLLTAAEVCAETELSLVIADGARRDALEKDRRRAADDLLAAAPGHTREAMAAEVTRASADALVAELAEIDDRLDKIGDERQTVGRALADADAKARTAETATAAADAQQEAVALGAELAEAAEDHVARAAAAAILRWAINRHRDTNQAPLIARAGAMLAKVTGGGFRTLKVGYDSADRPSIRAVRGDGTEVGVEGLSEGTRDQLYLALRVASLQERANLRLPLICDDVLIAADDERTGQLLAVLAEAARSTQVIVFSHHEHVIDAAQQAVGRGGFRLHRLQREEAFA